VKEITLDDARAELLAELRQWQAERLARTYADLRASARYGPAANFFLSDLYGAHDFSARDRAAERAVPLLEKLLPKSTMAPIERALELHALTIELDRALAEALASEPGAARRITSEAYGSAYRRCANRARRLHQIELIVAVGRDLDRVVRKPLIYRTLVLARKPARAAGFGELQDFLERGFRAFRQMGDATEFLATIEKRETAILERLFADAARPFDLPAGSA